MPVTKKNLAKMPDKTPEEKEVEELFEGKYEEKEELKEEIEKRKDPIFKISDLPLPPKMDRAKGKAQDFTLLELYPTPNGEWNSRTAFIEVDGVRHVMFLNSNQAHSLYTAGVKYNNLPAKGEVFLYRHTKSQTHCGCNFSFEGIHPDGRKKKDANGNSITEQNNLEFDKEWREAMPNEE